MNAVGLALALPPLPLSGNKLVLCYDYGWQGREGRLDQFMARKGHDWERRVPPVVRGERVLLDVK